MIEELRNRVLKGERLPDEDLRTLLAGCRRGYKAAQAAPPKKATGTAKPKKPSSGMSLAEIASAFD